MEVETMSSFFGHMSLRCLLGTQVKTVYVELDRPIWPSG